MQIVLRKLPKEMMSRKISQKKGLLAPLYRWHFMPGKTLSQMTPSLISLENTIFLFQNSPSASLPLASFLTSIRSYWIDNSFSFCFFYLWEHLELSLHVCLFTLIAHIPSNFFFMSMEMSLFSQGFQILINLWKNEGWNKCLRL